MRTPHCINAEGWMPWAASSSTISSLASEPRAPHAFPMAALSDRPTGRSWFERLALPTPSLYFGLARGLRPRWSRQGRGEAT